MLSPSDSICSLENQLRVGMRKLYFLFFGLALIFMGLLAYFNEEQEQLQDMLVVSQQNRFLAVTEAHRLKESSDQLTVMARLYAVTGNTEYLKNFNEILGIRDGRLPRPVDYSSTILGFNSWKIKVTRRAWTAKKFLFHFGQSETYRKGKGTSANCH